MQGMGEKTGTGKAPSSKSWVYWVAGIGGLLVGFVAVFLIVVTVRADWGVTQWGPFASWASSLFAMFAVGVAVTQTVLTRRDAAEARRRHREDLKIVEKRHRRDLKAAKRRHREQLDAQAAANARDEQFRSVKEITTALNTVYLDTQDFTDRFRYETDDSEANDKFLRHKLPWVKTVDLQTQAIQLSMIGVTDDRLQGFIQMALGKIADLRREVVESALIEILDLGVVDRESQNIFKSMKNIMTWAAGTMQPAYLAAVVREVKQKQEQRSK